MSATNPDQTEDLVSRAVAATLQLPVPAGPSPDLVSRTSAALREAVNQPKPNLMERIHAMPTTSKIVATLAIAASVLVCLALFNSTSNSRALADVAKALEGIRTATYDVAVEMKDLTDLTGGTTTTTKMKAYFEAPSRERLETLAPSGEDKVVSIMIMDHQATKGLVLAPEQKMAMVMDLTKIKKPAGRSNPFDMVRQFVQEGGSPAVKVELLGKKEIDGQAAIGFRTHNNLVDQTFWADPQSARLVRVDFEYPNHGGHGVMNHFRYDMELDPKLFSLEPPTGYTVNNLELTMPVEANLVDTLRLIAEHNESMFPTTLAMTSTEYLHALQEVSKQETEAYIKQPEIQKLMEKLKAQYPNDPAAFMKAWMETMMPFTQKLVLKHQQGMNFYNMLNAQNDSHYAGKEVKLDTPDRPIFWYKPTGAEKYHVIYADLSVKEVPLDEVQKFVQFEDDSKK
jgi:outer membrane lipoprotein-sorting protein